MLGRDGGRAYGNPCSVQGGCRRRRRFTADPRALWSDTEFYPKRAAVERRSWNAIGANGPGANCRRRLDPSIVVV